MNSRRLIVAALTVGALLLADVTASGAASALEATPGSAATSASSAPTPEASADPSAGSTADPSTTTPGDTGSTPLPSVGPTPLPSPSSAPTPTPSAAATPTPTPSAMPTSAPTPAPSPASSPTPASGGWLADIAQGLRNLTASPTNVPRRFILRVTRTKLGSLVSSASSVGLTTRRVYQYAMSGLAVTATDAQIAALQRLIPDVVVEPDEVVAVDSTQSPAIWNLSTLDQPGTNIDTSYSYPDSAGAGVKVYVIDTGVSANAQLGSRLLPGVDFTGSGTYSDCNGHGTHVSGTVASTTYGVAKQAYIVPVHVLGPTSDCAHGSGYTSDVVAGINWAIADNPAGAHAVINMSLGGSSNSSVKSAVAAAVADGIVVVVAAGNDSFPACYYSPANAPDAITVGALDSTNTEASFSNYGTCVDIWAPGVDIRSLDINNPGGTVSWNGTSMATPHVAGAAALYIADHPSATVSDVTTALIGAAETGVTFQSRVFPQTSPDRILDILGITGSSLANQTPPTVTVNNGTPSGAPKFGGSVSATSGTWSTTPTSRSFQWYSCLSASTSSQTIVPSGCSPAGSPKSAPASLTLDQSTVGKHMLVAETAVVGSQSRTVYSASQGVVDQAPVNDVAPALSGTAKVGSRVSTSDGTWRASPAEQVSYQWYSCSVATVAGGIKPPACTAIGSATGSSILLGSSLAGKFIVAEVKALNRATATPISSFSDSSSAVALAPTNTAAPVVSVSARAGANGAPRYVPASGGTSSTSLTATVGTWTGSPTPTTGIQWYRCDTATSAASANSNVPTDCTEISGANTASYLITESDVDTFVTAVVAATNSEGTTYANAVSTARVTSQPVSTSDPSISGTLQVGEQLSASPGGWTAVPAAQFSYQWYACSTAVSAADTVSSDCAVIASSATSSIFVVTQAQVNKRLAVAVKASNAGVSTPIQRVSASTAQVTMAPTNTVAPLLSIASGSTAGANGAPSWRPASASTSTTLSLSDGTWAGSTGITLGYAWYRCDRATSAGSAASDACVAISSASASTYRVSADDVGSTIVGAVTATNDIGTSTRVTASTLTVTQPVANTALPNLSGLATQGNVLSVIDDTWTGSPSATKSYQWMQCTQAVASASSTAPVTGAGCTDISGATSASFTSGSAQVGRFVLVRVSGKNAAQSTSTDTYSATTGAIASAPSITYTNPGANGAPRIMGAGGAALTTSSLLRANLQTGLNPAPTSSVYSWYRCSSSTGTSELLPDGCTLVSGASSATYRVVADDAGYFMVAAVDSAFATGPNRKLWTASTNQVTRAPYNAVAATVGTEPAIVGRTLTATPGTWTATPTAAFTYDWMSCTAPVASPSATIPAGCTLISGAKSASFTITPAQTNLYLSVKVTALNIAVTTATAPTQFSATSAKVLVAPANTKAPSTSSSPAATNKAPIVGSTVSATSGTWTGTPTPTLDYRWYSCPNAVAAAQTDVPGDCVAVTDWAPGKTFIAASGQVGAYLVVVERATNSAAVVTKSSVALNPVTAKPSRSSEPAISGTALVGELLTADPGTVDGSPTPSSAYAWQRCTANVPNPLANAPTTCSAIPTATGSTYLLATADAGAFISVKVTTTNIAGSIARVSASTSAVNAAVALTSLNAPTLAGAASDGSPLVGGTESMTGGTFSGWPAPTKTYQWFSCDAPIASATETLPDGCVAIDNANAQTYTLANSDATRYLTVEVTAANATNTKVVYSPTATKDVARALANVEAPALDQMRTKGETVTTTDGVWSGYPSPTFTYAWYRCTTEVVSARTSIPAGCVSTGAFDTTNAHYLNTNDPGSFVAVYVTATNRVGSSSMLTASTPKVFSVPTSNATVQISGNPWVGRQLSVTGATFDAVPAATNSFQWYSCASIHPPGLDAVPDDCFGISGASGATGVGDRFTVTSNEDGTYLMVAVFASNEAGSGMALSSAATLVKTIPSHTESPHIEGSATFGSTLSAIDGIWTGTAPLSYARQWMRCTAAVANPGDSAPVTGSGAAVCSPISTATGSTYVVGTADLGKYVVLKVTASNGTEDVSTYSASTTVLSSLPSYTTGMSVRIDSPSTDGAPRAGQTVTALPGSWSGIPAPTYTYAWYTCPTSRAAASQSIAGTCALVGGATGASLPLTREMVGKYPVAKVTGTNPAGNDWRYSPSTTTPVQTAPLATSNPTVSGKGFVGTTATATAGVWNASPTATTAFSWWQCTGLIADATLSQPSGCTPIDGANTRTLSLTAAFRDKYIAVMITATNTAGTTKLWSQTLGPVVDGPVVQTAPVISSTPKADPTSGGTVSVGHGTWLGTPTPLAADDSYQWYSCDAPVAASSTGDVPAGCSALLGEIYSTYSVSSSDVNYALLVKVTASNSHGTNYVFTKSTALVSIAPFLDLASGDAYPTITDAHFVGDPITATAGIWSGTPAPDLTYQWMSCASEKTEPTQLAPGSCTTIANQTASTYTPRNGDIGRFIIVKEIATNKAGSAGAYSASGAVIQSGPVNTAAPAITVTSQPASNGAPLVGGTVTADSGTWQGSPAPTFEYQWMRCASAVATGSSSAPPAAASCVDITDATDSSYDPVAEDRGKFLAVAVVATNTFATVTHYSATSAQVRMAPVLSTSASVLGSVFAQGTARAKNDVWLAFPAVTRSYAWFVCGSVVANASTAAPTGCEPGLGPDASTYAIARSQLGKYLVVGVTATNSEGASSTQYSASSAQIVEGPVNVAEPLVSNARPQLGQSPLTVNPGDWVPVAVAKRPRLTYQWYRCDKVVATSSEELAQTAGCAPIDGAQSTGYAMTQDDPGHALLVGVTGTNSLGESTMFSKSTALVTEKISVTVNPSIAGDPELGSAVPLSAEKGTWRGFPVPTTSYQWYQCTASTIVPAGATTEPAGCSSITGANKSTYPINSSDNGALLTVAVTQVHSLPGDTHPVTRFAATVGPVTDPPQFVNRPTVVIKNGSTALTSDAYPQVGNVATATPNTAAGADAAYQWYRCASSVAVPSTASKTLDLPTNGNCEAISGARSANYTVSQPDLRDFLTVSVEASNSAGSRFWWSTMSKQVQARPIATTLPSVDVAGVRKSGETLTADDGVWDAEPSATVTRVWLSCLAPVATTREVTAANPVPGTCIQRSDYTGLTYVQKDEDKGRYVTVKVSGTNTAGIREYLVAVTTSQATAQIPVVKSSPQVSISSTGTGSYITGETFLVSADAWNGLPKPTVAYQWYACDSRVTAVSSAPSATVTAAGCVSIDGQSGSQLITTGAQLGKYLLASSTATNAAGSATQYSASTGTALGLGKAETQSLRVSADQTTVPATITVTHSQWNVAGATPDGSGWAVCTSPVAAGSDAPVQCNDASTLSASQDSVTLSAGTPYAGAYITYYESLSWPDGASRTRVAASTGMITEKPALWTSHPRYVAPSVPTTAKVGTVAVGAPGAWGVTYPQPSTPLSWRGAPVGSLSTQWMRCSASHPTLIVGVGDNPADPADCSAISGAINSRYTPIHADAGSRLLLKIVATNSVGSSTIWTAGTAQVTEDPKNTVAPDVSGAAATNPILGETLSLGSGTWDGYPAPSYTYAWLSCTSAVANPADAQPAGCTVIPSQSGSTLQLTPALAVAGKYVVGRVTATNSLKSVEKYTKSTAQVYEVPVNLTAPSLGGNANVGSEIKLTSLATDWRATPTITAASLSYRWFSCLTAQTPSKLETVASGCTLMGGQTTSAITLQSAQTQSYVVGQVIATNAAGVTYQSSASTAQVKEKPQNAEAPTLSGTATTNIVGDTLSVTDGSWTGFPTPSLSYKWYSCTGSAQSASAIPAGCSAIANATTATFTLTTAEVGTTATPKYVLAAVTATNALNGSVTGTAVQTTLTRGPIRQAPAISAAPNSEPAASGMAHLGQTLTANTGVWTGFPAPTLTYSWFTCPAVISSAGAALPDSCMLIDGSANKPLVVDESLVGSRVALLVTATNSVNSVTRSSATTAAVTRSPVLSVAPVLSGASTVANGSNAVSVSTGEWTSSPAVASYAYAWFVCGSSRSASDTAPSGAECSSISGSSSSLTLPAAQAGKYVVAKVTATAATNKSGTDSTPTFTASFGPIRTAPAISAVAGSAPTVSGVAHLGETLTASAGTWTGFPAPSTSYDWYSCPAGTALASAASLPVSCVEISGASDAPLVVDESLVGARVALLVTATNSVSSVTRSSATTAAVTRSPLLTQTPQIIGASNEADGVNTVSVSRDTWQSYPTATKTYQWYVCSVALTASDTAPSSANCPTVLAPTTRTITLTPDLAGSFLVARVTATSSPVNKPGTGVTSTYTAGFEVVEAPVVPTRITSATTSSRTTTTTTTTTSTLTTRALLPQLAWSILW